MPDALRAVAGFGDIGRAAIARTIIARSVIAVLGGDRAANDGATDQPSRDACGNTPLRLGGAGITTAETAKAETATSAINVFFMASTFLLKQGTAEKRSVTGKSSIFRCNDQ